MEPWEDGPPADEEQPRVTFKATALRDLEPVQVDSKSRIWGDVLTRGCITFLASKPGSGKSTLTRWLIYYIATGKPSFLGMPISQEPCTILVLDYETPNVFRYAFWSDIFDATLGDVGTVYVADEPGKIDADGALTALRDLVVSMGVGLLVVDTMSAALRIQNENDNAEAQKIMDQFDMIAKAGCAVLLISHPSRGNSPVRGASAFEGASDTNVEFSREGELTPDGINNATTWKLAVSKNRVGALHMIDIQADGEGGFVAPYAPTDEELSNAERIVYGIVGFAMGKTISQAVIEEEAAAQRVSNQAARWAVRALAERGMISRVARGRYTKA